MQCNFSNRIQSKRESHKNLPLYSCNFDVNLKNEYTLEKNDQWIYTLIFSSKVFNNVHVLIKLWLLIFYVRLYFYTVMKFVYHNLSQFLIYRRCWKISVWRSLEEVLWLWWDSQGEVIQSVSWRVIILVKLFYIHIGDRFNSKISLQANLPLQLCWKDSMTLMMERLQLMESVWKN